MMMHKFGFDSFESLFNVIHQQLNCLPMVSMPSVTDSETASKPPATVSIRFAALAVPASTSAVPDRPREKGGRRVPVRGFPEKEEDAQHQRRPLGKQQGCLSGSRRVKSRCRPSAEPTTAACHLLLG